MGKICVALFGAGRAGTIHAENVMKAGLAEITWIVDEVPEMGEKLVKKLRLEEMTKVARYDKVNEILNDVSVDAVIVTVPTKMHAEVIKRSLAAGKAVFCEKPLTLDSKTTVECYDIAESFQRPLMCGFNRRFDPTISNIYEIVRGGDIGDIRSIKTCSRDPEYPSPDYIKKSGGIFVDACCHDIDLICWILGEAPVSVYAVGHAFNEDIEKAGDCDQVMIVMTFPGGVIGSIDMNRKAVYGYDQRLEILGSKGMVQEDNPRPTTTVLHTSQGEKLDPLLKKFADRYKDSYEYEMLHFLNVVSGHEKCLVTRQQVITVMRTAEACKLSLTSGQVVFMNN
ncbi:Trans-1,2-dihydrobenzene-1,2-diol dehydrogenase [Holothuria leucospilota]|uniref:Trans-1,2-dihydrobenzene-1,2-diol dehydrogenase n=1 Tax=Holothuria leucospilota TaxID=206669 RepID=A0A9Q0YC61_HOLLE|nr:Trans-1,2-dihydrobenzene-1,2-diol dehydrogenase [Holothuria leucospilota]